MYEDKRLIILTTSDADVGVMTSFAKELKSYTNDHNCSVIWRVIDGIKAYERPLPIASLTKESIELDWVVPSRFLSQAEAIALGLSLSREHHVFMMAPDMWENINDISRFIAQKEKGFEIVAAWRASRVGISLGRRLLTNSFNVLVRLIFQLPVHDFNTSMALMSPLAVRCMLNMPASCPSLGLYVACELRNSISELPVTVREIPGKKSSYSTMARIIIGARRLREITRFIFWRAYYARGSSASL